MVKMGSLSPDLNMKEKYYPLTKVQTKAHMRKLREANGWICDIIEQWFWSILSCILARERFFMHYGVYLNDDSHSFSEL